MRPLIRHTNLLLLLPLLFWGCDSKDSSAPKPDAVKSIVISASSGESCFTNTKVSFSVKSDGGKDLSAQAQIYVNGKEIVGFMHTFTQVGNFEVYAKYKSMTSNKIQLKVEKPYVKEIILSMVGDGKIKAGNSLKFKLKDNLNNDLVSLAALYVAGKKVDSFTHTFNNAGTFEVYAKYKTFTSNKLKINVVPPGSHIAKVLIQDFTGTWCGYCGPATLGVHKKAEKYPGRVIPVTIHDGSKPFSLNFPKVSVFGIEGFPTIWTNGYKDDQLVSIPELIAQNKYLGLAINYDLKNKKATVKVHYDPQWSGESILVVYLVEDGIIAPQANYGNNDPASPSYQMGNPIQAFRHDGVLKATLTKPLGDKIPTNQISNGLYTVEYNVEKKDNITDMKKTRIVAFVLDKVNKVVNVQVAAVNENKDFD